MQRTTNSERFVRLYVDADITPKLPASCAREDMTLSQPTKSVTLRQLMRSTWPLPRPRDAPC